MVSNRRGRAGRYRRVVSIVERRAPAWAVGRLATWSLRLSRRRHTAIGAGGRAAGRSSARAGGPGAPERRGPTAVRARRGRLVLAVLGGMVALLCLGGLGVGLVLYDQATEPDRSAPDVVVDNYLRALLVDRNDAQAALYACEDSRRWLASLQALRDEIDRAGAAVGHVQSRVTWGELTVSETGRPSRSQCRPRSDADRDCRWCDAEPCRSVGFRRRRRRRLAGLRGVEGLLGATPPRAGAPGPPGSSGPCRSRPTGTTPARWRPGRRCRRRRRCAAR